jgi:hypothetical protein
LRRRAAEKLANESIGLRILRAALDKPNGGRTPACVRHIVHAEVKQHPMKIQPYHGDSVLSVSTAKASGRTFRYNIFDLGGSSMYHGPLSEMLPSDVCLLMVHPHEERKN